MAKDKTKEAPAITPVPATEERQIVPLPNGMVPTMPNIRAGGALAHCQTNLDIVSLSGRALLLASRSAGDVTFDANGVAQICATHWAVFPDSGADPDTGEVTHFVRVILFDANGRTYRTTSEHASNWLSDAVGMFSDSEWEIGIPIVIQQRRSPKTGRTYHDFRIDPNIEERYRGRQAT
jgi:hypothetical protein